MTTMTSGLDHIDLVTPELYAQRGYPWEDWALLRREAPVYWYERAGVTPFWAITKYDDIQHISRDPETFISSQRLVIRSAGSGDGGGNDPSLNIPNLISMDPPEHGKYRNATSRRFSPRGMRLLEERIDEIAEDVVDDVAAHIVDQLTHRREADFVRDVAARMPLAAICELLAVDRDSWEDLFRWTNEFLGSEDPEYQQGRSRRETWQAGVRGLQGYFMAHIERKRREPDNSVMTTLVQAEIDGTVTSTGEVTAALETQFLPNLMARYPSVSYSFEGDEAEFAESVEGLVKGFGVIMFVMYGMLAIPLKSYWKPAIILSAIPFGMIGAIWGHAILGLEVSFLSMCGMVALAGVVVNDALVMVAFINRHARRRASLMNAVRQAGEARFRAILLTSLTTAAGVTPFILEESLQAQFLIPMAVALAAGVLFATAVTLVLVPALYLIMDDVRSATRWMVQGTWDPAR